MATMPDCTSSLTPKGSRTSRKRGELVAVAGRPRSSSGVLATRRRPWRGTAARSPGRALRLCRSARTLTSRISRCTEALGSSSTTLITLTSLLSCLVTCSSGSSSTSTTTVIREISGCSVGPTARESMLKPRRENRPAMRARTPGLFSTRTDRVCLLIGLLLAVPRRRPCPRRSGSSSLLTPGRHHRPHHRVAVDDEVDDDRAVVDLHGLRDRRVDVLRALAAQADAAVGVGELDEVGDPAADARCAGRCWSSARCRTASATGAPCRGCELLMIATLIGMSLMTQVASSWLVIWKQPSPSMAQTVRSGSADLGAHGRRHGVAHGAEAAGVEPGVRALVLDELRGPHLVLADAGDVDRLRAGDRPDAAR